MSRAWKGFWESVLDLPELDSRGESLKMRRTNIFVWSSRYYERSSDTRTGVWQKLQGELDPKDCHLWAQLPESTFFCLLHDNDVGCGISWVQMRCLWDVLSITGFHMQTTQAEANWDMKKLASLGWNVPWCEFHVPKHLWHREIPFFITSYAPSHSNWTLQVEGHFRLSHPSNPFAVPASNIISFWFGIPSPRLPGIGQLGWSKSNKNWDQTSARLHSSDLGLHISLRDKFDLHGRFTIF